MSSRLLGGEGNSTVFDEFSKETLLEKSHVGKDDVGSEDVFLFCFSVVFLVEVSSSRLTSQWKIENPLFEVELPSFEQVDFQESSCWVSLVVIRPLLFFRQLMFHGWFGARWFGVPRAPENDCYVDGRNPTPPGMYKTKKK